MAQYDRKILVPYLQDVCSIELLCVKITREINESTNRIRQYHSVINRKIINPEKPKYSDFEPEENIGDSLAIIAWIFLLFLGGLWLMRWSIILGLIPVGLGATLTICFMYADKKEKKEIKSEYQRKLQYWEETIEQNEKARTEVPKYYTALQQEQKKNKVLQSRLYDAQTLRKNLYDVNIVPKQYRNIYVAYYLYDYFSTCRENDLDKIIQTMLLDEIKKKLDRIIVQNEQIILNQRIQLALQEQSNQIAAEHHRLELDAIARLERNQELQLDYQNMIIQNQAVTNFLLAADYLYK